MTETFVPSVGPPLPDPGDAGGSSAIKVQNLVATPIPAGGVFVEAIGANFTEVYRGGNNLSIVTSGLQIGKVLVGVDGIYAIAIQGFGTPEVAATELRFKPTLNNLEAEPTAFDFIPAGEGSYSTTFLCSQGDVISCGAEQTGGGGPGSLDSCFVHVWGPIG